MPKEEYLGEDFRIRSHNPKDFDKEFHSDHRKLNKLFKRMGWKWRMKVY